MPKIVQFINYTTREGDTFDALALSVYNEEKKAHLIIKENPQYSDVLIFDANVLIKIPIFDESEAPKSLPPWRQ